MRVPVSAFASVRSSGLIAMGLDDDDYLGWVRLTNGNQDLILVTRDGMSIRFNERDVRVMGRPAGGVSAIRFQDGDELAGMEVITDPRDTLLVVTEYGYGKRTPLAEYKVQRRYGSGIRTLSRDSEKTGRIIGSAIVKPEDDLTLITAGGMALRTEVGMINIYGRSTSGVKLMDLPHDDVLVSMAIVSEKSEMPPEELGEGAHTDAVSAVPVSEFVASDEFVDDDEFSDDNEFVDDDEFSDDLDEADYSDDLD